MDPAEPAVSPGLTLRNSGVRVGKRDQDRIHDSCFPSRKQTLQQENLRRMPGHHSMVSAKLQEGGRGGRWQDRWAGQVGRTAAWPGRKGPAPLRPQRKPGDGEQPAPTPPDPQQLPQDRSWAPNPRSQGHTHGTPTTLMLGRGEPSRSPWLPRRAGSSGVRAGGASPGLGLSWTSPPAKPYTLLCQARTQECSRESREEPWAAP